MATENVENVVRLNPAQVRILRALDRNADGLTRGQIEEKANVALTVASLGPVEQERCKESDENHGYPSLHSLEYVTTEVRPGRNGGRDSIYFVLTDAGRGAVKKYSTRKRAKSENRVPHEIMVPIARKWQALRTYAFESFTDGDCAAVKEELGAEWAKLTSVELRMQLVAIRKQGKLKQDRGQEFPEWYQEYRDTPHFVALEKEVGAMWDNRCAVNADHDKGLCVVHRHFHTLGAEQGTDAILLCEICRNRARLSLATIPDECPDPDME